MSERCVHHAVSPATGGAVSRGAVSILRGSPETNQKGRTFLDSLLIGAWPCPLVASSVGHNRKPIQRFVPRKYLWGWFFLFFFFNFTFINGVWNKL